MDMKILDGGSDGLECMDSGMIELQFLFRGPCLEITLCIDNFRDAITILF